MPSAHKKFRASDYLLTPRDVYSWLAQVVARISWRDAAGVFIILYVGLYGRFVFNVSWQGTFFLCFIAALVYWRLDSRVAISLALAGLVCIPLLLILFNQTILLTGQYWAERVAVWVYYFLVIGVLKQIAEYMASQRRQSKKKKSRPKPRRTSRRIRTPKPGTKNARRKARASGN
jgi:hypothetical protein